MLRAYSSDPRAAGALSPMARQRRGLVGSTNLVAHPRDCADGQPAAPLSPVKPAAHPTPPGGDGVLAGRKRKTAGTAAGRDGGQPGVAAAGARAGGGARHARRDRFRLPLVSSVASAGAAGPAASAPESGVLASAEAQLARNIGEHERKSKSFKDETWYASPIGGGSKKAVLLVALQQRDLHATGSIRRVEVEAALAGAIFALEPGHIRDLLASCAADRDALVDYRQFVEQLQLPSEQPEQDPVVGRQQSYIDKIRARSQALQQQASPPPVAPLRLPLVSPVQTGPHRDAVRGSDGHEEAAASPVTVLPPFISPLRAHLEPAGSPELDPEIDRLSFEYDKERRQRRADAKARTLLAHLNRVHEYSRRQQQVAESHESLRLAAKARHRQEHFERAFEEENRVLRVAQRQGKGGLRSEYSHMQRNVSTESMFSIEPARS